MVKKYLTQIPFGRRRQIFQWTIFAATLPTLLVIFINSPFNVYKPPPDEILLAHFTRNETTLNQLVEMAQHDKGLTHVDDDRTKPDALEKIGVSRSRIADYRRLLASAGVPNGFRAEGEAREIKLSYWLTVSWVAFNERHKGFAYLTEPPSQVFLTLNKCDQEPKTYDREYKAYRYVRGNWYLFYQYVPG